MPTIPFDQLSDAARVWVFASDRPLARPQADRLLGEVDRYLAGWHAHGEPLTASRDWRDDRFLVIGVDGPAASGCSIDGLFRSLRALEPVIGASLVAGGRVFYREPDGQVAAASRDEFADLATAGRVGADTRVFDTSVTGLGELRERFETEAARSWHATLLPR
ncbi:MAG: hypothetical protein WKG32_11990 [Gemmatimonadaceae bacterium]